MLIKVEADKVYPDEYFHLFSQKKECSSRIWSRILRGKAKYVCFRSKYIQQVSNYRPSLMGTLPALPLAQRLGVPWSQVYR